MDAILEMLGNKGFTVRYVAFKSEHLDISVSEDTEERVTRVVISDNDSGFVATENFGTMEYEIDNMKEWIESYIKTHEMAKESKELKFEIERLKGRIRELENSNLPTYVRLAKENDHNFWISEFNAAYQGNHYYELNNKFREGKIPAIKYLRDITVVKHDGQEYRAGLKVSKDWVDQKCAQLEI